MKSPIQSFKQFITDMLTIETLTDATNKLMLSVLARVVEFCVCCHCYYLQAKYADLKIDKTKRVRESSQPNLSLGRRPPTPKKNQDPEGVIEKNVEFGHCMLIFSQNCCCSHVSL